MSTGALDAADPAITAPPLTSVVPDAGGTGRSGALIERRTEHRPLSARDDRAELRRLRRERREWSRRSRRADPAGWRDLP